MGAWYIIVNPSRRQYLEIGGFGESFKSGSLITGASGRSLHAMAVAWLVCRFPGADYSEAALRDDIAGGWFGDPIYFASDEAPPDLGGIPTSTPERPDQNLSALASAYEDVTPRVIKSLCEKDDEIAEILVAGDDDRLKLRILGRAAIDLKCEPLAEALEARLGEGWRELCERAKRPWPED
jgi:hypothetical protein